MPPVLTAVQWILGKALLYVVIGLVDLVICFTLGMLVFDYRFPTDPSVLLVATLLYLMAGVFFGMMMGNATGNQSAAIQGVQMGSFLLSLAAFRIPVCDAEHSAADSLVVQLPARNPLHSDCSQLHSARRGMGYLFHAGGRIASDAGLWLIFS